VCACACACMQASALLHIPHLKRGSCQNLTANQTPSPRLEEGDEEGDEGGDEEGDEEGDEGGDEG